MKDFRAIATFQGNMNGFRVIATYSSGTKRKTRCPQIGWEDLARKNLKETKTSREKIKSEALTKLGWRRSVHSCVSLIQLGAVVSC